MKKHDIAIIFDVDGTLIDVKQSYNQTILLSSYLYIEKVLGYKNLPHINKWFTKTHVRDLKSVSGFNNDFTCTSALILFFVKMINPQENPSKSIPLLSESFSKVTVSDVNSLNNEWNNFLSHFKDNPDSPPEKIIKESVHSSYIRNTGQIKNNNYLERIFLEIYYGEFKFRKFYRLDPKFSKNEIGLYQKESLLISFDILDRIKKMKIPVAIFTGRPKLDLDLIMDHFSLNEYFDQRYIITLSDCLKEEDSRKDGVILTKPNPWGINQLKKLLPVSKRYILIGDSTDDIKSAFNANINAIYFNNNNLDLLNYPNVIDKMNHWDHLITILKI